MTTPLWMKPGVSVNDQAMRFMAGQDAILDRQLLLHDIEGTRAHAAGLADIGAITSDDANAISEALDTLRHEFVSGAFVLDDRYEDAHTAIESYLTDLLGELGKRVHLGRSRNDQVLTALRLYIKDALTSAAMLCIDAAGAALDRARAHEFDPMPGYTHLQRAVPSSVGLWMASFTESFLEDAALLRATRDWIDACPLGTAAGYGVNLDLPRDAAAERLGFARTLVNPMHAQATRGKAEAQTLSALWQAAQTIRRLAWDLTLFSSSEFDFVTLPQGAVTGSSIMPNKQNPDLAELLRGVAPTVGAALTELHQLLALPSGYHRDLQNTKPPLLRGCMAVLDSLALIPWLLTETTFNLDAMRSAIDAPMYATDEAVTLTSQGTPFRDAYRSVAENIASLSEHDPVQSLRTRTSLGGPGKLKLDALHDRIEMLRAD